MTRFCLLLTSPAFAHQSVASALQFATAAISNGHQVTHIFLYEDGVYCTLADSDLPTDEPNLSQRLAQFCQQQQIPLLYCVTAAEKRGVTDNVLAASHGYTAAGLAEFAMSLNDVKLVQF